MPHGATIHVMDEEIDHGDIIVQDEVIIHSHDTSLIVYEKVINLEVKLFEDNFFDIIDDKYVAKKWLRKVTIMELKILKGYVNSI